MILSCCHKRQPWCDNGHRDALHNTLYLAAKLFRPPVSCLQIFLNCLGSFDVVQPFVCLYDLLLLFT